MEISVDISIHAWKDGVYQFVFWDSINYFSLGFVKTRPSEKIWAKSYRSSFASCSNSSGSMSSQIDSS